MKISYFKVVDMDNEERRTTFESLSVVSDALEQPLGTPSLIGLQQSTDHGIWDKFGFARNKNYYSRTIISKVYNDYYFSITYNASTENALIDVNDDILTVCISIYYKLQIYFYL